jgi:hypothetical protein
VVLGGIAGGVQQSQGNVSRASTAGSYLVPISPLVNNYFNFWTIKFWCLLMRKIKGGKERLNDEKNKIKWNGGLDLIYGFFWSNNKFW